MKILLEKIELKDAIHDAIYNKLGVAFTVESTVIIVGDKRIKIEDENFQIEVEI